MFAARPGGHLHHGGVGVVEAGEEVDGANPRRELGGAPADRRVPVAERGADLLRRERAGPGQSTEGQVAGGGVRVAERIDEQHDVAAVTGSGDRPPALAHCFSRSVSLITRIAAP